MPKCGGDIMDRKEALRLLKGGEDGIAEWNRRRANGEKIPNLRAADVRRAELSGARLSGARLSEADLGQANVFKTDLFKANLFKANLWEANLSKAYLFQANLGGAYLFQAKLIGAYLSGADLSGASLVAANLSTATLGDATLTNAFCGRTIFADVYLSEAKGLDSVKHGGPSTIGIDALISSRGKIPEAFLRDCGVPEALISYLPSLISAMSPIQFYSCFISYSHRDEEFAKRLHADLQHESVRYWYVPEDLKIGERFRVGIDESIRLYDKLLLVLSKNSVKSQWVEKEVETAMERERQENRVVLFPIGLDEAAQRVKSGWPADVRRSRHIGDFRQWKEHDAYRKSLDRLLRDLKAEAYTDAKTKRARGRKRSTSS
jgi:hypothetical protein